MTAIEICLFLYSSTKSKTLQQDQKHFNKIELFGICSTMLLSHKTKHYKERVDLLRVDLVTSWSRDKLISESIQWKLILWELILWYRVTVLQACCCFINEYKQQQDPNKRLGSFSFGSPVQKRNLVSRRQGRSNQGGTVCERAWTIPWPPKHALWEHPMISWDVVFMYCQPSLLHSLLQRKQGSVHHWWHAVWLDQAIDCFMPHERHTKLQLRERYCTHYDVTRAVSEILPEW